MNLPEKVYMVEFEIPVFTKEMSVLIPNQREMINQMMLDQKISNYSLAADRSMLWVIFTVATKSELLDLVTSLPMTPFMKFIYTELLFHNMLQVVPSHSLN